MGTCLFIIPICSPCTIVTPKVLCEFLVLFKVFFRNCQLTRLGTCPHLKQQSHTSLTLPFSHIFSAYGLLNIKYCSKLSGLCLCCSLSLESASLPILPMSAWGNTMSSVPRCSNMKSSWLMSPCLCYSFPLYVPCWAAVVLINFVSPVPSNLTFNFPYVMISTYFSYINFANFHALASHSYCSDTHPIQYKHFFPCRGL